MKGGPDVHSPGVCGSLKSDQGRAVPCPVFVATCGAGGSDGEADIPDTLRLKQEVSPAEGDNEEWGMLGGLNSCDVVHGKVL